MLDFLLRRDPFAAPAADLFQLAEEQRIKLYVSSLSFSHTFYILRKITGSAKARALLLDLSELVVIAAVDSSQVKAALRSASADFEDAIQYYAATTGSGPVPDGIITRDPTPTAACPCSPPPRPCVS